MARPKSASLHHGLLIRKGEASPAPPPALAPHQNTAEEVERNFRDGEAEDKSQLSPSLDRFVSTDYNHGNGDGQHSVESVMDDSLPMDMEPQAEIRTVADILALGRTRGALSIPQAALGHANGGAIVTLHLSAAQMERLDTISDIEGPPVAQLVMNAVTDYIRKVVTEN